MAIIGSKGAVLQPHPARPCTTVTATRITEQTATVVWRACE